MGWDDDATAGDEKVETDLDSSAEKRPLLPSLSSLPAPLPSANPSLDWLPNVGAGCVVALINVPLSISLAVAARSSPTAGIVTAVWSGLLCCVLGGSALNITGPTGALAGILTQAALSFGSDCLPLLAISSAIVTFVAFLLRWDRYVVSARSCTWRGLTAPAGLSPPVQRAQSGRAPLSDIPRCSPRLSLPLCPTPCVCVCGV